MVAKWEVVLAELELVADVGCDPHESAATGESEPARKKIAAALLIRPIFGEKGRKLYKN